MKVLFDFDCDTILLYWIAEPGNASVISNHHSDVGSEVLNLFFYVHKQVELPPWTDIVKTAKFKELAPYDPDWYYIRAASMARKIYLRGGLGVGAFRRIYGGSQRNGSRPPHFCKSSGSVARHILQQLQNMNIIDVDPKGGRRITSSGQRDLDQVAGRIVVAP
ncbi:hypothetical protein D5086_008666 [Populus alba]|uniref:Uncharacterized protein n=1 Tax=Populus alba TaxID=43335 RepID=A0ACC4CG20_POPAL